MKPDLHSRWLVKNLSPSEVSQLHDDQNLALDVQRFHCDFYLAIQTEKSKERWQFP